MSIIQIGTIKLAQGGAKGVDGESNANRIAVTTLAELQAGTANKIWSIQGDIDLGTTTLNIPSGVVLKFEGGKITNGTLNGDATYIIAEELLQIFGLDTEFTGTFDFRAAQPEWFGANISLAENQPYFRKLMEFVRDNGGGNVEIRGNGIYTFNAYNPSSVDGTWYGGDGSLVGPDGVMNIYSDTHVKLFPQSTLKVIGTNSAPDNKTNSCNLIVFYRAKNSSLSGGGKLIGNRTVIGNKDYHAGVIFFGDSNNVIVEDLEISEMPSDALSPKTATNYETDPFPLQWETGGIDLITGLDDNTETSYSRTITKYSLTGNKVGFHGWTRIVDGFSYQQWMLPRGEADVYFYDVNDNFIRVVDNAIMYSKLTVPTIENDGVDAAYARLVVKDPRHVDYNFRVTLQSTEFANNITIRNITMHDCGRQGISIVGAQDWLIENCVAYNIYGSPGYFIDIEDGGFANHNITIRNNKWWDCQGGGIRIYSGHNFLIEGNTQKRGNWYRPQQFAIVGSDPTEGTIIKNNRIEDGVIVAVAGYELYNNVYVNSYVELQQGISRNNTYYNSRLQIANYANPIPIDYWKYFIEVENEKFFNSSIGISSTFRTGNKISLKNITVEGDVDGNLQLELDNPYAIIDGLNLINVTKQVKLGVSKVKNFKFNLKPDIRLSNITRKYKFDNWDIDNRVTFVLATQKAKGTITCNGVLVGDIVTINGLAYTAVLGTPADDTEFQCDDTSTTTAYSDDRIADNLIDAINGDVRAGKASVTVHKEQISTVVLTSTLSTTAGNSITLASSNASTLALSGSTLTGGGTSQDIEFNNLRLTGNNTVTNLAPLISFTGTGTAVNNLTLKNCIIKDEASVNTNWSLISMPSVIDKIRITNSEFETLTAGNLLNIGTGVEDATWLYKDNIFTTVLLNNTTGTELNNIEE